MGPKLKTAWICGLTLGIIMGALNYMQTGLHQAGIAFLFFGLIGFFGGNLFISVLMYINKREIEKLPYKNTQDAPDVKQERRLILAGSYNELLGKCIKALDKIEKGSIYKKNSNEFILKTRISWKSWGEIITLSIREINDAESEIVITSRPKLRTVFIDCGKNFENVERFINLIDQPNIKSQTEEELKKSNDVS